MCIKLHKASVTKSNSTTPLKFLKAIVDGLVVKSKIFFPTAAVYDQTGMLGQRGQQLRRVIDEVIC